MRRSLPTIRSLVACETGRKLWPGAARARGPSESGRYVLLVAFAACLLVGPMRAMAPGEPPEAVAEATNEAEEHGRGAIDVVARFVNFAIFAGALVYLLRSPIRTYLADRSAQVRSSLVSAAELKQLAAAQIAELERKMQALPGELEALRAQGAQEIAAEEARIRAAAAAERERLLEQARRDIDLQVRVAERQLASHAADLAVGVASERIKKNITDEDQKRLVDRYVQQLKN